MGQYYRVMTKEKLNKRTKISVYDPEIDGSFIGMKLMEHSWWGNAFVGTICQKIHFKPMNVYWVGDYSNDVGFKEYHRAWSSDSTPLTEAQVSLFGKYLVNHTKNEYVDCNEYYDRSVKNDWCVHPLPLLTCVGNGLGGGDYRTEDDYTYLVGSWCGDLISVENEKPENMSKLDVEFKERW